MAVEFKIIDPMWSHAAIHLLQITQLLIKTYKDNNR